MFQIKVVDLNRIDILYQDGPVVRKPKRNKTLRRPMCRWEY